MIGISLGPPSTSEARTALHEMSEHAHVVELRLDFMDEYDLPGILEDRPCPVIVTNRPEREGGRYRGSEQDRVRPLLEAIDIGVEFVDIEHDSTQMIHNRNRSQLIVSYHDFRSVPKNLDEIHEEMSRKGADVVKVVGMARTVLDNLPIFTTLDKAQLPTIAMAMGESGLISRILALRHESCLLTYATPDRGEVVAPGQLPISTMKNIYHVDRIGVETTILGVLSQVPVPEMVLSGLNTETVESGLDAVWVPFVTSGTDTTSPGDTVQAYRRLGVRGYIVEESAQLDLGDILEDIESVGPQGRINVIRQINGRLIGQWATSPQEAFSLITDHMTMGQA